MTVYRCSNCGSVAEELSLPAGARIPCKKCGASATLFDTVFYVEKLAERYLAMSRELQILRSQDDEEEGTKEQHHQLIKDQIGNTLALATAEQHQPLQDWLSKRQIKARFDYAQVDTTGFYDEAAIIIGEHYSVLSGPIEQVRYAYRQDWSWINIELRNKSKEDQEIIKDSFRQLYSYTLFSRFNYKKQNDVLGLGIQSAQPIRKFFTGSWLEWWAFMCVSTICLQRDVEFHGTRAARMEFQDGETREIDVLFLLKNSFPIIVECKTGEFRQDLEKYSNLRRRFGADKSQIVICNPDLTNDEAKGLTSMYDLTFTNLDTFTTHMNIIVR